MSKPKEEAKTTATTRCEQGPAQDIVPQFRPQAKTTDVIDFSLLICKANSQALVLLDGKPLKEADGKDKDEVFLTITKLSPGLHQLYWSVFGVASKEWQTRAEIKINGAVSFLIRTKNSDNNPTITGLWEVKIIE